MENPLKNKYGGIAQLGARYNRVPAPHTKLNKKYPAHPLIWGYSSAGRALEWHSRGQRFDPAYLHHHQEIVNENLTPSGVRFSLYAAIAAISSPALNFETFCLSVSDQRAKQRLGKCPAYIGENAWRTFRGHL